MEDQVDRASARLGTRSVGLACVLLVSALTGCQGGLRHWVDARCDDLSDCVRYRIGLGVGLYADAEVTAFLKPAVGVMDASLAPHYTTGWDPRPGRPSGQFRTAAFPLLLVGWPVYGFGETRAGYGDTHPYLRGAVAPLIFMGNSHLERSSHSLFGLHALVPNPRLEPPEDEPPPPATRGIDRWWIGASGTALLPTFDLGFNLPEFVDFVVGLSGLDLVGDDYRREPTFEEKKRTKEKDAEPPESPPDS